MLQHNDHLVVHGEDTSPHNSIEDYKANFRKYVNEKNDLTKYLFKQLSRVLRTPFTPSDDGHHFETTKRSSRFFPLCFIPSPTPSSFS